MPSRPIPVRLKPEVIVRLDRAADAAGLDRSDVIKLCLNRFLDELDASPDMLLRDWSYLLKPMDGRTTRYAPEPPSAKHATKPVNYRKALAADRRRRKGREGAGS